MRGWTIAIGLVAVCSLLPLETFGCTYFPPSYSVAKDFTVDVTSSDGLTFAGVRVVLMRGNQVAYATRTDAQGKARFEGIVVGQYSVEIDQLGTFGGDTAFLTVSNGAQTSDIKLRWPSSHILHASDPKGILLDSRNAKPLVDASVVLVRAIDGSLSARGLTGEAGTFDLGTPEKGLYFVKADTLRPGQWEPRGEIPVLVESGSTHELTVAVGETSCGMWYSELCGRGMQTVSRISGKITDTLGAAIDRAQIELLQPSEKGKSIYTTMPDKSGFFAMASVAPGEYQLRISAVGFAPAFVPVKVMQTASDQLIEVRLNALGSSCVEQEGGASRATN